MVSRFVLPGGWLVCSLAFAAAPDVAVQGSGQNGGDPVAAARAQLAGLAGVANQAVADFNVPGVAIAVVYKDELIYAEGFGKRNVAEGLAVTADTLFAIGSTTKAMTATLLGMLADDGKIDFDAPVRTYLPDFTLSDPDVAQRITVRDLVTHRSGMPRHDLVWYNHNEGTRAELIHRFATLELTAGLRERFQYNNLMFATAGHIAARTGGVSDWETLIRGRLFAPLGMSRTNMSVLDSQRDDNHALPYKNDDDRLVQIPFRRIDLIGPAGSVNSSVREMSEWLKFNLNRGVVTGQTLIAKSTLADIQSHHMPTGIPAAVPETSPGVYGMGWMVGTYRGKTHLYHGGGIDGFITNVMFLPNDDLGLVAFTNTTSTLPQWLNLTAADLVLGSESKDWLGEALQRREVAKKQTDEAAEAKDPRRKLGTKPGHKIAAYVGAYHHPGYGRVVIKHLGVGKENSRRLAMVFNGIEAPLEHWHYDVWNVTEEGQDPAFANIKIQFARNQHGEIASVAARLEVSAAPIVFLRQPGAELNDPEYLARFVGQYKMPSALVAVELSGAQLKVTVAGRPTRTLVPDLGGRFTFKSVPEIGVQFAEDASELKFLQPNGIFKASRM